MTFGSERMQAKYVQTVVVRYNKDEDHFMHVLNSLFMSAIEGGHF